MRHVQTFMLHYIGGQLRIQYDHLAKEPIPERWVDLINQLNEAERFRRGTDKAQPSELQRFAKKPTTQ
jgi:hypothetical protein